MKRDILRQRPEMAFADELDLLAREDTRPRPPRWRLSPWAVVTYLLGGTLPSGAVIRPKYVGPRRLIEIAVATLVTDRALLLLGVPGTAKTSVAEHLAAAISGDSALLVQGTAGTTEETLRYGWNYALLLSKGPCEEALVPGPVMRAMQEGKIVRVEELTRVPTEVEDSLITLLSEKVLPIPELKSAVEARPGFNLIATANSRDRGVHELSTALQRRFNTVILPVPATVEEEIEIVRLRIEELGQALTLPLPRTLEAQIERVVTIFRELREGQSRDGARQLKSPSGSLSPAEAIAVLEQGLSLALHFGEGELHASDLAAGLHGAIVRDPTRDRLVWREYLETIVRERPEWADLYSACQEGWEGWEGSKGGIDG
jgi:MoxR-like ATPase